MCYTVRSGFGALVKGCRLAMKGKTQIFSIYHKKFCSFFFLEQGMYLSVNTLFHIHRDQ